MLADVVSHVTPFEAAFGGTTRFTTAAFNVLHTTNGHENFAMSPVGLTGVLAILSLSTAGETKSQIHNVSGISSDDQVIIAGIQDLQSTLKSHERPTHTSTRAHHQESSTRHHHKRSQVALLTRAFYDTNSLNPSPLLNQTVFEVLEMPLEPLDFSNKTAAAERANEWLTEISESKLSNIVSPDTLGDNLAIFSSLNFNAIWKYEFVPKRHEKHDFHYATAGSRSRKFMTQEFKRDFNVAKFDEIAAEAIELPFADGRHSMYVFKSTNSTDLYGIERHFRCSNLLSEMQPLFQPPGGAFDGVLVYMPDFKVETTVSWQPIFELLGITDAFNPDSADFSAIFSGQAHASTINQKIVLAVNDKGAFTEENNKRELREKLFDRNADAKAYVFGVDRPFIALIFDKWTNTPLISAVVYDPDKTASVHIGAPDLTKVSEISKILQCTDSVPVTSVPGSPSPVNLEIHYILLAVFATILFVLVLALGIIKCISK